VRWFDSGRGHSQSIYPSRFSSREPVRAGPDVEGPRRQGHRPRSNRSAHEL